MAPREQKVIVAMSGGVDSAVAASLLIEQGYDVTGVFMCLGAAGGGQGSSRGCCSPQDAADARRAAQTLGIELFVLDLAGCFEPIVEDFVSEYARGRTPNPCIRCNSQIKFGHLLERAESLGICCVATGHYARIVGADGARPQIARAMDLRKDQSYALFDVARESLSRILLPIGELESKDHVRRIARSLDLVVHDKADSQEICFVEDDDYVSLLTRRRPGVMRPGDIVNSAGEVLGAHDGYARYTIGQRRGLRIAADTPLYVTRIDAQTATVTVGPREDLLSRRLSASGANWHYDVSEAFDAVVQIRYNHRGAAGRVRVGANGTFEVDFDDPVSAVAPGQAAVVYDGQILLGGGWID